MAQSTSSPTTRTSGGDYGRSVTDDLADKAANLAEKTGEHIERVVQNVSDQSRQATEQFQEVADNFKTALDKSVKDQPLTTLAVVAGLGFVIGALWKS
jgi:ElaB/YqjD/DUF883 family membrane-anchored ribosome-binding protein